METLLFTTDPYDGSLEQAPSHEPSNLEVPSLRKVVSDAEVDSGAGIAKVWASLKAKGCESLVVTWHPTP